MAGRISAVEGQDLLRAYATYDEHVDVVSIFQWLMTATKELPSTVRYFERFPVIDRGGRELTPDFTILFNDGHAIVGEIASVALHDNSIDKLLNQLGNYDTIDTVPASATTSTKPVHSDVLLLVPSDRGQSAFNRIHERIADLEHPYNPVCPLVIAEYVRTTDMYIIKRLQNAGNGDLNPGSRKHHLGQMLNNDFHPKAHNFVGVKTEHRFINDEPSILYLATHLLQQTLPTEYGAGREDEADVAPADLADTLRRQYKGGVRAANVRQALELLQEAGYARPNLDGKSWRVSLKKPRSTKSNNQVHEIIVERASKRTQSVLAPLRERSAPATEQVALF